MAERVQGQKSVTLDELRKMLGMPDLVDPTDYHNFAINAKRHFDVAVAFAVAELGASLFPMDSDLLADCLSWAPADDTADAADVEGRLRIAESFFMRLCNLGRLRTWRGYDFSIDYLIDRKMHAYGPEKTKEILDTALEISEEFIRAFPDDGRAYTARIKVLGELEVYCRDGEPSLKREAGELGRIDRADSSEAIMKKLVIGDVPEGEVRLPVPACCLSYADYLLERGRYKEAIEAALVALRDSCQSQAGVRIGYLVYLIALCQDSLLLEDQQPNLVDGLVGEAKTEAQSKERAQKIKGTYLQAYNMLSTGTYREQIIRRMTVLSTLFELDTEDIPSDDTSGPDGEE